MKKILIIILISFLLVACTINNNDIIKAQHIQDIYFDICEHPSYIITPPNNWNIYTEEEIKRAKELYDQSNHD